MRTDASKVQDALGVHNPFEGEECARRYHQFRPAYHSTPFEKVAAQFPQCFERALDVACGTGQATVAMSKFSSHVVGCDASLAMLEEARRHSNLRYIQAPAEKLPFEDETFSWVNISMAIHWVDQQAFLKEARRVLSSNGILTIDNFGFSGKITPDNGFEQFNSKYYRERFPPLARHANYPLDGLMTESGLRLVQAVPYEYFCFMDLERFVGFLLTQSNVLSRIQGLVTEMESSLKEAYEPFFKSELREMRFSGEVKIYRKGAGA